MYLFLFKLMNVLTPIKIFFPLKCETCMEEMEIYTSIKTRRPIFSETIFWIASDLWWQTEDRVGELGEGEGKKPINVVNLFHSV